MSPEAGKPRDSLLRFAGCAQGVPNAAERLVLRGDPMFRARNLIPTTGGAGHSKRSTLAPCSPSCRFARCRSTVVFSSARFGSVDAQEFLDELGQLAVPLDEGRLQRVLVDRHGCLDLGLSRRSSGPRACTSSFRLVSYFFHGVRKEIGHTYFMRQPQPVRGITATGGTADELHSRT